MSESIFGKAYWIASTLPIEVKAIPNGDDWIVIWSGISDLSTISEETKKALADDAIARAKAERAVSQFPIVASSLRGDRHIYGFTKDQKDEIRELVREELKGRNHDDQS